MFMYLASLHLLKRKKFKFKIFLFECCTIYPLIMINVLGTSTLPPPLLELLENFSAFTGCAYVLCEKGGIG